MKEKDVFVWDGVRKVPEDVIDVVIENGVKTIPKGTFRNYKKLRSVTLPDSLNCIGDSAFYDSSLRSIDLKNVEYIGKRAFALCTSLQKVIGGRIVALLEESFECCWSLEELDMSTWKISSIEGEPFSDNRTLSSVILPDSLERIGDNTFLYSKMMRSIDLKNVKYIGKGAFAMCTSLQKVTGGKVISLGDGSFHHCSSLKKVDMSTWEIDSIGYGAFKGDDSLEELRLPNSIRAIHRDAFIGCHNLTIMLTEQPITIVTQAEDAIKIYGSDNPDIVLIV